MNNSGIAATWSRLEPGTLGSPEWAVIIAYTWNSSNVKRFFIRIMYVLSHTMSKIT